jgi:hypothetical protein
MERYEGMKAAQGTGKLVIAAARKVSGIIWTMLTRQAGFKESRMTNQLTPLQSTKLDPQNFLMQEYISKLNKAPAGWGWR